MKGYTHETPPKAREYDYRSSAIKAAKDLGYDDSYIKSIKAAKTPDQISAIMTEARHAQMERDEKSPIYRFL